MTGRAWNSTLRPGKPLGRTTGLQPGAGLARSAGLSRSVPVRPVSARRAAENRERKRMVAAKWPGALNGGQERPLCVVYALSQTHRDVIPAKVLERCWRWADDCHEPLTRARGGSITDPGNALSPCRACHDAIGKEPEWACRLGLLKHSWPEHSEGDGHAA